MFNNFQNLVKSQLPWQTVMSVWTWLNPNTFTYEAKVKPLHLFLVDLEMLTMDFFSNKKVT